MKYLLIFSLFLLLLFIIGGIASMRMKRMIERETQALFEGLPQHSPEPLSPESTETLPEAVQRWLHRSGMVGRPEILSVEAIQQANLKMKPEQEKWHRATALQHTVTHRPGFIWSVRLQMNPLMRINGRDKFTRGKGQMLIRLFSILNIVNASGPKIDEGSLQRYLGELVWMPSLALSPYIQWETIDQYSAMAHMEYMGTSGSGRFFFNEEGDFIRFEAMRFMGNEADAPRRNWVLTVQAYREFDGIRVPSHMQATWQLDEGDWTWLDLEILSLRYNVHLRPQP